MTDRSVFTFPTTDMAFWAEEVAGEAGIPAELVPAPPQARALCDLALETFPGRGPELESRLTAAGVSFNRWPPSPSPRP